MVLMLGVNVTNAQPWSYGFGTATGTHSSGESTTFISALTSLPTNGGTYRVRIGSGSGSVVIANPGSSLGTTGELQLIASTGTSTNKFGVYNWSSTSTTGYVKYKLRTTSGGNGNLNFSFGTSIIGSDNNGYTNQYNNSIASFTIVYTSSNISSVVRRISGSNTQITSSGLADSTDQEIEVYANNSGSSQDYVRSGTTYTLATRTWDLWIDGTRIVNNAAKAGNLVSAVALSGFGFFAESSTSNSARFYIDDLEYGNALPNLPTLNTPTASSITTTTATLGATVATNGGAFLTSRGTVWGTSALPTGNVLAASGVTVDAFTHSRSGFTANTLYTYRGYAINSVGTGYSGDANFTTLSLAPTIGAGSGATTSSFTANWSAPAPQGAATFTYSIEVDDDENFGSINFTQTNISSATITANVNTGLSSNTPYYYRVRAVNAGGNSAWSATLTAISTTASTSVTYSNTQFTSARNITRGTTELPIYRFQVGVTNSAATLSSLSFTTPVTAVDGNSNYVNTDITNFKAFLTTSTTFSNSTQLGATSPSGKTQQNLGETAIDFTSLATTLNVNTTYYIWLTADVLNGAVAGRKIVVNAPTVGITGSVTGSNSATGVQTIEAVATNYYLNVGGSVTTSANYFTQPNGGGTSMTANSLTYTSNDVILNIPISVTNTGDFTLGNGSKIVVQNGGSLTVGSANTITGIIDVNDGGTLTFNNTNISSTLGTLGATSSTVIYSASGAQAVSTSNYANLTISGGNTKTISGAAAVSGALVINSSVLALGTNSLTPTSLTLDGLGTKNGSWGSTVGSATYKNATYFGTTGTGTVTPSNNTAATASFSSITSSQSINYGTANVSLSGVVASGSIFPANGETVSVTINGVAQTTTTTSGNGSFSINYTTSTLPVSAPYTITYAYAGTGNGFLIAANNNTATTLTVNAVTNNWIGGTSTWNTPANWSLSRVPSSLNDNITISSGTPTLDVNYTLGTGRTLTLSGSAALIINPSSSITIAGTADFGGKSVTVQSDGSGTGAIGTISGTLSNATNVTVQRYAVGSGRNWRFLSSPVSGVDISSWMSQFYVTGPCLTAPTGGLGSINDLGWHTSQANIDYPGAYNVSTNNRAVRTTSIRQYVESNSTSGTSSGLNAGWADVATNTTLTPGKGFRAFIRGAIGTPGQLNGSVTGQTAVTINLNGTLNQGAVNAPTITYSGSGRGWNLIGNPYACAYDWTNINTVKTQIVNNTIHVFNPGSNGYISYNPSSGGSLSNGIIPSGAAFFVQATGNSQAAVTFNEAAKVTGISPTVVHKGAKANEFSIKYSKDSTENDVFIAMLIDNATLNNDGYDIIKLRNENLNLASYGEDSMQLMLSAIPPIVSETRIKLNVEATVIGTYNFDFNNMDNFQSNITVSLFDRYTNKTTDVRKNTKYTFDMGPGVNQWGNNRFELILNLDKTGVDEFALLNQTQMLVYPNPATDVLNINISNSSFKNSDVVVYNISGTEVIKTNMANSNAQLNIETLSNGVYFVKVTNQNGFNKTVKFVK